MSQLGEDVLDLTSGAEGSLWFADDDAAPAAVAIGELCDEPSRLGAPGPRNGPRTSVSWTTETISARPTMRALARERLPAQTLAEFSAGRRLTSGRRRSAE